jgi:hypothetical protein
VGGQAQLLFVGRRRSVPQWTGCAIGLLLCETHNSALAEYALRDVAKPIGVSTYRVTRELPAPVRDELPTVEDLQEVVAKLRAEMEQLRKERPDE